MQHFSKFVKYSACETSHKKMTTVKYFYKGDEMIML